MRRLRLVLLLVCCWASSSALAEPRLERVVLVSRHGIRSPIRTVDILNTLTRRTWPVWPVGAGEMTEHGAKNLAYKADFLRAIYVAKGLLPAQGCPAKDALAVWSDVADNRTRQSGAIMAEHLAPGCSVAARHAAEGTTDPVFNAMKTKACSVGMLARAKALAAAAKDDGGLLRPEDRHALETLQGILAPDACTKIGAGICLVPAVDASIAKSAASLALGSTIAEGIYLEYVQGLPLADVGWGGVKDAATVTALMPVHNRGMGILRRTPMLAARRGAVMARMITALLAGNPLPEGAPSIAPGAKVIMLAGHDSNLLYLAGLFGLDWQLPDQPSLTPPDAALAFEAWRDPETGARTVRVEIYAQTLAQLREARPLEGNEKPRVATITPAVCGGGATDCTVDGFATGLEKQLGAICN